MNRLRNFMYGRYGFDQLSRALIIAAFVISLLTMFSPVRGLVLLSYIPLIYAVFRIFSKNVQKRMQENAAYFNIESKVKNKFIHLKLSMVGTKTHKYYTCSKCRQTIRVPRGKGKICITCPKCRHEFVKKT